MDIQEKSIAKNKKRSAHGEPAQRKCPCEGNDVYKSISDTAVKVFLMSGYEGFEKLVH